MCHSAAPAVNTKDCSEQTGNAYVCNVEYVQQNGNAFVNNNSGNNPVLSQVFQKYGQENYPSKVMDTTNARERSFSIGRAYLVSSSISRLGKPILVLNSIANLKNGRKKSNPPPASMQ